MDKFGVETTRITRVCPLCGKEPTRHGSVLLCPTHGSKPFELPDPETDAGPNNDSTRTP